MSGQTGSNAWRRRAGIALLAAGALLLAGCATGYRYVQPDAAGSGGYYTSDRAYSGAGYYDYYDTGPYYGGTSGWGYYNGSQPYAWVNGGFGGYGGWGYWPGINFGFGVSSVWNYPGYWGPWYASYPPLWWGCHYRHCGHYRTHSGGAEHAQYLGVMSLRPELPSSGTPSPQTARGVALPQDFGSRGAEHWARDRAGFDRERFVRAPVAMQGRVTRRPDAALAAPGYAPRPLATPAPARVPADFAQPRSDGYRAPPRATERQSFQPRPRAPETAPTPRPRDHQNPEIRRH
ncbi:MAG TPA: hypothetical protein VFJ87_13255 [Rhodanobacteraceae bacterium]|nr:hypothetical protein [Rhodanobacteraceae bacterium]